jgi:hypothetical protein
MNTLSSTEQTESYTCKYCEREFKRESSLAVHVCEQKKRYQEKDERGVQIGYQAYLKFFEYTQGSAKLKTFDDFAASPYYRAFVKFGRYCVSIKAISVPLFIEYVIKNNKKLDHWAKDSIYQEYLMHTLVTEPADRALVRAMEYSIEWGEENNANPQDVIRFNNSNRVCQLIAKGTLSPWVVYNSVSGMEFLGKLNEEQQKIIWDYIYPETWERIFSKYIADQEYVKEMLKQAGW